MALFGSLIAGLKGLAPAISQNIPSLVGAVSAFVPQNNAVRQAEQMSAQQTGGAPPGGLTKTQMLGVGLAGLGVAAGGYGAYRAYKHYRKKRSSSRRSYF